MIEFLQKELVIVRTLVAGYLNQIIIICSAVLFLTLAQYHSFGESWIDYLVFYAALPVLSILLLLRKNPLDFGLRPGNWRTWSLYVIITCLLSFPVLLGASRAGSLKNYYESDSFSLYSSFLPIAASLFAWEFIFRGYLLFGLRERFGQSAILIQMVPFVLLHIGKPEAEILSTIPMGLFLGYVAYRGKSCWPAIIIHIFINITFRTLANWL